MQAGLPSHLAYKQLDVDDPRAEMVLQATSASWSPDLTLVNSEIL